MIGCTFKILLLFLVACTVVGHNFDSFKTRFGRKYLNEAENLYRQNVYNANMDKVNAHNANPSRTFDRGETQFVDKTDSEFEHEVLMNRGKGQGANSAPAVSAPSLTVTTLPDALDWRTTGKVSPVKNQASCGSCWSFAAVAMLESAMLLKNSTLMSFSEQNLVDCCRYRVNPTECSRSNGCNGGWSEDALQYVARFGIAKSAAYLYTAKTGTCKNTVRFPLIVTPYVNVTANEAAFLTAIQTTPIGVGVQATSGWNTYKTGVFSQCLASTNYNTLNHMVLMVGYNSSGWTIKNSWASTWGAQGYMQLPRTGNNCGVLLEGITTAIQP